MDGAVVESLRKRYRLDDVEELLSLVPPFTAGQNLDELGKSYRLVDVMGGRGSEGTLGKLREP